MIKNTLKALATIALVAVISSSCKKMCTCMEYDMDYFGGQVTTTVEIPLSETGVKKCSQIRDVTQYSNGTKIGIECK